MGQLSSGPSHYLSLLSFFHRAAWVPGPPPCPLQGPSVIKFLTATSPLPFLYSFSLQNMSSTTMGPKFISYLPHTLRVLLKSMSPVSNSSCGAGPRTPPAPPWGPSVSTCSAWYFSLIQGPLSFSSCVARVPRTPPAPVGGRQSTTLLCLY